MHTNLPLSTDDRFRQIVRMYVDDLGDYALNLSAAQETGDRETLRRLSHRLKGSAGGYGFHELGGFAVEVERLASDSGTPVEKLASSVDLLIQGCRDIQAMNTHDVV